MSRQALADGRGDPFEWGWIGAAALRMGGDPEAAAAELARLRAAAGGGGEQRAAAALELARCALEMWQPREAEAALGGGEAVAGPELAAARAELLAIAAFQAGDEESARRRFEALTKASSGPTTAAASSGPTAAAASTIADHYLGLLAFNAARYDEALRRFERASARRPGDYEDELYRGWCLFELGRLDASRDVLERLATTAPSPEVLRLLGRVELRAERFAAAAARFRQSREAAPGSAEACFGLATALRRAGRSEEAKTLFDEFRRLHGEDSAALKRAYVLDQRAKLDGGDLGALEALAAHFLSTGDPTGAERSAWRALRLDARRHPARLTLARALAFQGRLGEAAVHYRRLLEQRPDHPEANRELRDLVERHGRRP